MRANAVSESPFKIYEYGSYKLLAGDHFAVTKEHLPELGAVYDRAALIALPEPMRTDYVDHLRRILPSGCVSLLISLEYDPNLIGPPPFDIYQEEIQRRFGPWCEVKHLTTISATIKGEKGFESAYRITGALGEFEALRIQIRLNSKCQRWRKRHSPGRFSFSFRQHSQLVARTALSAFNLDRWID